MVERPERAREVERRVAEREPRCIADDELGVGGRTFPRKLHELGDFVDADDLANERGQGKGERARAAADVDRALVAARQDERSHLCGEVGSPGVLVRRDLLRGSRETTLSHRRRRAVHGRDRSRCGT